MADAVEVGSGRDGAGGRGARCSGAEQPGGGGEATRTQVQSWCIAGTMAVVFPGRLSGSLCTEWKHKTSLQKVG